MRKEKYYHLKIHQKPQNFKEIIKPFAGKKVLDVGCGTGWVGKQLKDVSGIDMDEAALQIAGKFETVKKGSAENIPFSNQTFEGIIARDIVEHLFYPLQAVKEFHRVLKPKGLLYLSAPDEKCKFVWDDYTHVRPFNKRSMKMLLEDGGFKIISWYYESNLTGWKYFRIFNIHRTLWISKLLARIGIFRGSIVTLAEKI